MKTDAEKLRHAANAAKWAEPAITDALEWVHENTDIKGMRKVRRELNKMSRSVRRIEKIAKAAELKEEKLKRKAEDRAVKANMRALKATGKRLVK